MGLSWLFVIKLIFWGDVVQVIFGIVKGVCDLWLCICKVKIVVDVVLFVLVIGDVGQLVQCIVQLEVEQLEVS